MISIIFIVFYILIARIIVIKTKSLKLRQFAGPILGSIPLGLIKAEVLLDTLWICIVVFVGALYLGFLPGRLQAR